jgi:glycosyltransferase involved in cell wall biosynthesis
MSSLFRGWPKEQLACLYTSQINPVWTVCDRYWQLRTKDLRVMSSLVGNAFSPTKVMQPTIAGDNELPLPQTEIQSQSVVFKTMKQWRRRMAGQAMRDLDTYRVPALIKKEMIDFKPQVIYSMLGSTSLLQLVNDLADYFSVPVVPHFMDDWPSTLYRASIFRSLLRKMMRTRLTVVLERAPERLVIGDAMAAEYTRRYGGKFSPFMKAVEPVLLEQPIILPKSRKKIKLVYVGGLHLNRWRSLRDIGQALQMLQVEGFDIEAVIYSQPRFATEAKKLDMPPVMYFGGSLTSDEVLNVLRDADILLHVESFDRASLDFTRYSVSSKIPESMFVARPVFAYGPEELASIRYVRDSGAGLAVGVQSQEALSTALRQLINSESLRNSLGANGHEVARYRHDAVVQRQRFRSILEKSTNGKHN